MKIQHSLNSPVIGIIGGTIWGNRGAESMLVTTIGKLKEKYPNAKFKIFSYYPQKDSQLVNKNEINILNAKPASLALKIFPFSLLYWVLKKLKIRLSNNIFPNIINEMRECNVLLDIGGISFVDGREVYLPYNLLTIWPALLLGVPVVKLAQAMGPFNNPINRLVAKLLLPRCKYIFARGSITLENLQEIKLNNVIQAPDIAFLYKPEYSLSNENNDRTKILLEKLKKIKISEKKIICIAPSSLVHQKSGDVYLEKLLDLIKRLGEDNAHFFFLPNSTREGSDTPRNNDIYLLNLLQAQVKSEISESIVKRIDWVTWDLNTQSIRQLMALSNLVITSRFHAMVSGLSLAIPTLVIGWSHKYEETLADFGVEKYALDFNDKKVDPAKLARNLLQNEEKIHQGLVKSLVNVRSSSSKQFNYVAGKILN